MPVLVAIPSGEFFIMHVRIASVNDDLFTDTKLASGSDDLGAACMQNTSKSAPCWKMFQNSLI